MIPGALRAPLLLGFLLGLHLLALGTLLRGGEGGLAAGVVLLTGIPGLLAFGYLLGRLTRPLSWLDLWVLVYAGWSLTSVVLYAQPANPSRVGAFAYGLYYFILPILCFFAAKAIPAERRPLLVSGLLLLNAGAILFGLYAYFVRPDYYTAYLTRMLAQTGAAEEWQFYARLQSYLGSTSIGYLGATSLILLTVAGRRVARLGPGLAILFVCGAMLSLQRASFVGLGVALLFLAFLAPQQRVERAAVGVLVLLGLVALGWQFAQAGEPLAQRVVERLTTEMGEGVSAFAEDRGYAPGLRYLERLPFGVGLGGTASAAENAGLVPLGQVADANFMRIAADLGGLGLLFFACVLGTAAGRALPARHRNAWLAFLVVHCGIMLSTNVQDSFYVSQSFWILLAVLDGDHPATRARVHPVPAETQLSGAA